MKIKLEGKYNQAIVYGDHMDQVTIDQIQNLLDMPFMKGSTIRIMPDAHAGAGSVIGFTADMKEKVVPNLVGVDIGCGILTISLGKKSIDYDDLDRVIRNNIPGGFKVRNKKIIDFPGLDQVYVSKSLKDKERLERSLGSLGGGNHFIEVAEDEEGNRYLLIHSGSRNFGHQIASIYQKKAIKKLKGNPDRKDIPKDLAYLEGEDMEGYIHDMVIAQDYAELNRKLIGKIILDKAFAMDLEEVEYFETVHNYIDPESRIVRKGAVSAREGEKLVIPLNMRDGSLIAVGKGNPEWNKSAPHGAGRVLSRKQARESLDLESFKESMEGIYTTSVHSSTLDEAPMAYKPKEAITDVIGDTVEIIKQIKPVYNFKA